MIIQWHPTTRIREFDVQASNDGVEWQTVYSARQANSDRSYVYLPNRTSRYLRLDLRQHASSAGYGIVYIEVKPAAFSRSINTFFQHVAKTAAKGLYPKYLYGEQTYWTCVGITVEVNGERIHTFEAESIVINRCPAEIRMKM